MDLVWEAWSVLRAHALERPLVAGAAGAAVLGLLVWWLNRKSRLQAQSEADIERIRNVAPRRYDSVRRLE